jgi:hypothetical protein
MSPDDLALSLQRALDRLVCRLRRGAAPERTQRRLLIVQIDGLSRGVLERALATGRMPFLKRLLRRDGYHLEPMTVGLPTSTPVFQMAAMYGVRPDIPGFHYFDRERQADIHFPRRGHAVLVEAKQAAGRRGFVHGGSTYGCVFTGGAVNNLFSFARLTEPSGQGVLAALSPFVVLIWVCLKNLARTIVELGRAVARLVAHPAAARRGWRWTTIKIGFSVWVRGFFTLAVSRDLYAGVSAVSRRTPSGPGAGRPFCRCAASTARSASSRACSGACPSTATTSTCWPTMARLLAGPTRPSPEAVRSSDGSSRRSWTGRRRIRNLPRSPGWRPGSASTARQRRR